jgi:hypothetical protein
MTLIDQIIEDLINTDKSLVSALLKTKVLASRIDNSELLTWVNNELVGYSDYDKVPKYRSAKLAYQCTLKQGWDTVSNQQLPLLMFPEEVRQNLMAKLFNEGVEALEEMSSGNSGDFLGKDFGADMCAVLTTQLKQGSNLQILQLRV